VNTHFKLVAQRRVGGSRPGVLNLVVRLPGAEKHLVWRAAGSAPSEVIALPLEAADRTDAELLDYGEGALSSA
jgi:hypothetical protein